MLIKRANLQTALEKVKSGLAGKEIIEQSASFIFMDGNIVTYNDEIAISVPMKKLNFTCAVPGTELLSIISKIKDDELDIDVIDNEFVIKGAKFNAGIRVQSEIILPVDTLKPEKYMTVPPDFRDVLKMCAFSTGSDMNKPVLTCLHICNDKVESTDGFRLTQAKLSVNLNVEFLLPSRAALELVRHEIEKFALTDGWVHFKLGEGVQFSCRTFEGVYPKFDDIIKMWDTHILRFPVDMDGILERASTALIKETSNKVNIYIKDNKITVTGISDVVRYEEISRMRSDKDEVQFNINPTFLRQILSKNSIAEFSIGPPPKLKFTGDNFIHVLAIFG